MLSKKCQYALHALIYLANQEEGTTVTIGEIATEKNIPKKFLEAILLDLRNAGILASRKGKSGGYYFLKKPKQISIIEVIRLVDGAVAMLPCVSLYFYERCKNCDEKHCGLHDIMIDVRDANLKILEKRTVADLIIK